jgi:hypothetical protein
MSGFKNQQIKTTHVRISSVLLFCVLLIKVANICVNYKTVWNEFDPVLGVSLIYLVPISIALETVIVLILFKSKNIGTLATVSVIFGSCLCGYRILSQNSSHGGTCPCLAYSPDPGILLSGLLLQWRLAQMRLNIEKGNGVSQKLIFKL